MAPARVLSLGEGSNECEHTPWVLLIR